MFQGSAGSIELEEISLYLLAKFSALVDEAEKDPSRLSCISRFRNAETLVKSYVNTMRTSRMTDVISSTDLLIRDLLYNLISALSECRIYAQQHRGLVAPKNGFLQFKHFWFIRQMNRRLDEVDKKLQNGLLFKKLEEYAKRVIRAGTVDPPVIRAGTVDPPSNVDYDDDDEESAFSSGFLELGSAVEKVNEFIVERSGNESLKGIGIVGFGGSGKTAIARQVFDSFPVRNLFSPRIWVSLSGTLYDEPVSLDLRVKILQKMLEQAGCDVLELMTAYVSIPELTEKLYHRLMGKRYLIVLDEVWHINDWYGDLGSEFAKGNAVGDRISHALPKNSGGRIIVTSRRGGVVREMIGGDNLIPIDNLLGQEICWSVFSDAVLKDGKLELNEIPLSNMEEEISKKCVGLPLAARTLADIIPEQVHEKQ